MKKDNFKRKKSGKLKILEAVQHKHATKEMLEEIVKSIDEYISKNPVGTLENYGGAYGKVLVDSLKTNYPELIKDDWRSAADDKVNMLMQFLVQSIKTNEKINYNKDLLKLAIDYLHNKEEENRSSQITIVTGYPMLSTDIKITPVDKI